VAHATHTPLAAAKAGAALPWYTGDALLLSLAAVLGLALLCAGLLWWRISTKSNKKKGAQHLYNRGIDAYQRGQTNQALQLMEKAFALTPQDPTITYNMGAIYLAEGDSEKANQYFHLALVQDPTDTATLYNLGLLAYEAEDYPKAISHWLACLSHSDVDSPDTADVYFGLGQAYESLGQDAAALEIYQQLLEAQQASATPEDEDEVPPHGPTLLAAARITLDFEDLTLARQYLEQALAHQPNSAEAHLLFSLLNAEEGLWPEAEEAAKTAVLLDKSLGLAHNQVGVCAYQKGDFPAAVKAFEQALGAKEPHNQLPCALNNLALAYERIGQAEEALRCALNFWEHHGTAYLTDPAERDHVLGTINALQQSLGLPLLCPPEPERSNGVLAEQALTLLEESDAQQEAVIAADAPEGVALDTLCDDIQQLQSHAQEALSNGLLAEQALNLLQAPAKAVELPSSKPSPKPKRKRAQKTVVLPPEDATEATTLNTPFPSPEAEAEPPAAPKKTRAKASSPRQSRSKAKAPSPPTP
jgi:tetratricopeptide (TPR) repeat protein